MNVLILMAIPGYTDSMGSFSLKGSTTETTNIDVVFKASSASEWLGNGWSELRETYRLLLPYNFPTS
jgi:hypothetical protein